MIKKYVVTTILITIFFSSIYSMEPADMFPDMKGWKLIVGEKVYVPENLFDIINGAADSYLDYDFQKLYTSEYIDDQERRIRVYIFEHSNPLNTFGIYSQERYRDYNYNDTGTQGFQSPGIFYFITGPYYIQISGSDDKMDKTLQQLAVKIETKLDQNNELPSELKLFPDQGKIPYSEKYIANDFLGYNYFYSAFTADYKQDDESFSIFIISPENQQQIKKMLNEYLDFTEFPSDDRDRQQFEVDDPYNGTVILYITDKYLFGITGGDDKIMNNYLSLLIDKVK